MSPKYLIIAQRSKKKKKKDGEKVSVLKMSLFGAYQLYLKIC